MSTLNIAIDLSKLGEPTNNELEQSGYDTAVEFWADAVRLNPNWVLKNAEFSIQED